MATLEGAEVYFQPSNHLHSAIWAGITDEGQKQGAIAHAKRTLSRLGRVDDIEEAVAVDVAEGINPEYAIYEQALWMVRNSPKMNADNTMLLAEASDPETDSNAIKAQTAIIAPEALRWLGIGGTFTLSRG